MKNKRLALALLASLVLLVLPWLLKPFYVGILTYAGIYAIAVVGLALLLQAGQISLGHAAFMGLAAYTSALLSLHFGISAFLTGAIALVLTGIVGIGIGWITLRLRGHYLPLATLAYGIALSSLFVAWISLTGGASGVDKIPPFSFFGWELRDDRLYATFTWIAVLLAVAALGCLRRSRSGRAIAALESHDAMARSFGVDTTWLRIKVFVFSIVLAALAGVLYVHLIRFVSPSPFALQTSFKLLIMTVVGGPASGAGAVMGALTIEGLQWGLQDVFARYGASGNYEIIVFGAILVVILIRWPHGIWPFVERFLPEAPAARSDGEPLQERPSEDVAGAPLLELKRIGMRFGGLSALDDVSLVLRKGEFAGLIGPNGAGKTTLFSIISGLQRPTHGELFLRGKPLPRCEEMAAAGVARTFQHVQIVPHLSVIQNVALGTYSRTRAGVVRGLISLERGEDQASLSTARKALERVGLAAEADRPAASLALGQQRIVEIARALAAGPELLLLDEPAAGLRFSEKFALVRLLRRLQHEGMTILLVEHDMELVMSCVDRLVVIDRGKQIAEGSPAEVLANAAVIAAYLGGGSRDRAA